VRRWRGTRGLSLARTRWASSSTSMSMSAMPASVASGIRKIPVLQSTTRPLHLVQEPLTFYRFRDAGRLSRSSFPSPDPRLSAGVRVRLWARVFRSFPYCRGMGRADYGGPADQPFDRRATTLSMADRGQWRQLARVAAQLSGRVHRRGTTHGDLSLS